LPIVSALIPVLSDKKNTGTGGMPPPSAAVSGGISAVTRFSQDYDPVLVGVHGLSGFDADAADLDWVINGAGTGFAALRRIGAQRLDP
jgi:hypothetical protein